jgi:hypothetical protein
VVPHPGLHPDVPAGRLGQEAPVLEGLVEDLGGAEPAAQVRGDGGDGRRYSPVRVNSARRQVPGSATRVARRSRLPPVGSSTSSISPTSNPRSWSLRMRSATRNCCSSRGITSPLVDSAHSCS